MLLNPGREEDPLNYFPKNAIWVTDGKISRRISKEEPIPDGFYRGRHYINREKDENGKSINAVKAGIASGISRRAKKTLK